MLKTASQIADLVLVKCAIDLPTLRRVSSGLLKRHGVRAAWVPPSGSGLLGEAKLFRRYKPEQGVLIGPAQLLDPADKTIRSIWSVTGNTPVVRGPFVTGGGRRGDLPSIYANVRGPEMERVLGGKPLTGKEREVLNRIGLLHEGAERAAVKPGKTTQHKIHQAWGMPRWASPSDPLGMALQHRTSYGHVSPRVILQEHNIVSKLPMEDVGRVRMIQRAVRQPEWEPIREAILHVTGRDVPYGSSRLSRHQIKRVEEYLQGGSTPMESVRRTFKNLMTRLKSPWSKSRSFGNA